MANLRDIQSFQVDGWCHIVCDAWVEGTIIYAIDDDTDEIFTAEVHGYNELTGDFWQEESDLEWQVV